MTTFSYTVYTKDVKTGIIENRLTRVVEIDKKKAVIDQMTAAQAIAVAMRLDGKPNEVSGLNGGSNFDICFRVAGNPNLRFLCRKIEAVKVETEVSLRRVCDMMIGAIEGGSTYWAQSVKYIGAVALADNLYWYDCPELLNQPGEIFEIRYDDPDKEEGNGKGRKRVTSAAIKRGLSIMANDCPKAFAEMLSENDDSTTADIFLQCVVLGDVIYG